MADTTPDNIHYCSKSELEDITGLKYQSPNKSTPVYFFEYRSGMYGNLETALSEAEKSTSTKLKNEHNRDAQLVDVKPLVFATDRGGITVGLVGMVLVPKEDKRPTMRNTIPTMRQ